MNLQYFPLDRQLCYIEIESCKFFSKLQIVVALVVSVSVCGTEGARTPSRDRCYDFENIFAEKFSEYIGVFGSNYSYFLKKIDHNIGF
jgi:hypothetical protein